MVSNLQRPAWDTARTAPELPASGGAGSAMALVLGSGLQDHGGCVSVAEGPSLGIVQGGPSKWTHLQTPRPPPLPQ